MTAPAWDGAGQLFVLGTQLTNLTESGAYATGANQAYVTNALVTAGIGLEYGDGQEITQLNGAGETCVYYRAPDTLVRGTIESYTFCSPDPNVMSFAIGGDVLTRPGVAEVQSITITGTPTGGSYRLRLADQTTAPIAYNALAAAIQAALEALSNVEPGDLTVTGTGPFTVTFAVSEGNPPQLTADGSGLTGGTDPDVTVTTTTPGTGFTSVGYAAPQVGNNPKPNGVGLEFWTRAVVNGSYASDLPYVHWVIPRAFLRKAETMTAGAEAAMTPVFSGFSNQNANWGSGPRGDWPFISDRVWQYARVATLPDLTPGYRTVT